MQLKTLRHWVKDYLHAIHKQSLAFLFLKPPSHYLGYIKEGKAPVILIPGVFEKWHFLKAIADPISHAGYPIYVLEHLGYNTKEIPHAAQLVRELINEKRLEDVVIIAHSKGGLIGKYLLSFLNSDGAVKKLLAIATPFKGSYAAKYLPLKSVREFLPESEIIKQLHNGKEVNKHIVSIFGVFDNHVWPEESCRLEGAKNIEVDAHGHHAILFDKKVKEIVLSEVRSN